MAKKILVLPGDGIGPEVTASAVSVLEEAAGSKIEILYSDIGQSAFIKTSEYLPAETLGKAADADAIISGGVFDKPADRRHQNPVRVLKKQLNMHTVVRKFSPLCKYLGNQEINMIVISGNPDTLQKIQEAESLDGVTIHRFLSAASCKKLFQSTKRIAVTMNRGKITCVHRISMFQELDGMFVDQFYKEFAGSSFRIEDMEVGEVASEMMLDPSSMDVIISTDIYGIVIAGIAAGMVGGSYLTPVGNIGESVGLFEPMHGPNPRLNKEGVVNPTSAMLSGAMAMDFIGMPQEAERIRKAVKRVYGKGTVTPDVGGKVTRKEFTELVVNEIRNNM